MSGLYPEMAALAAFPQIIEIEGAGTKTGRPIHFFPESPTHKLCNQEDARMSIGIELQILNGIGTLRCDSQNEQVFQAFLVNVSEAKNSVLVSVAHAFFDKEGAKAKQCEFRPMGLRGHGIEIDYYEVGTTAPHRNLNSDWAVAVLKENLIGRLSRLGYATIEIEWVEDIFRRTEIGESGPEAEFFLASYNERDQCIEVSSSCRPFRPDAYRRYDTAMRLPHYCSMEPGWSGAPLLMRYRGGLYAVSVHHSQVLRPDYDGIRNMHITPNMSVSIRERFRETIIRMSKQD